MNQEVNTAPLDFIVIGSGEVVSKYWLRSEADGSLKIPAIVSLEPEETFRQRNPSYRGGYSQTTSVDDTLSRVTTLMLGQDRPNIALETSAEVRLAITTGILSSSDQARLFIEKPYVSTRADLDEFGNLIAVFSNRLHLSGKYANGRANILYPYLPEGKVPERVKGRLIEGTEYFEVVKRKLLADGVHQYLVDGPELDLGFHLVDIIGVGSQRFGGIERVQVNRVYDLKEERPEFEEHYGFGAELGIWNSTGTLIIVDLQAGKADGSTERFIEFDYGDFVIGQEYTPGDSIDPVYVARDGFRQTVIQHPSGYNYYAQELHPLIFCRQSQIQQMFSLYNTSVCLDIKARRQALTA